VSRCQDPTLRCQAVTLLEPSVISESNSVRSETAIRQVKVLVVCDRPFPILILDVTLQIKTIRYINELQKGNQKGYVSYPQKHSPRETLLFGK
jgi:hypothetical protein